MNWYNQALRATVTRRVVIYKTEIIVRLVAERPQMKASVSILEPFAVKLVFGV